MIANNQEESTHRSERGQSLVELAISLTVMLLLLSGAVSFGMALFSYVAIRDAAGEGALYGSIKPYVDSNGNGKYDSGEPVNFSGANGICNRVQNASTQPVNMSAFGCTNDGTSHSGNNIDVIGTTGNACEGTTSGNANGIQVTVEYNQPVFMPFMNAITGGHIHLTARVTDTILEPRCP
jgi:Flp pilus assembly protein TadG